MLFPYKYSIPIFISYIGALCPVHLSGSDMEKRVCFVNHLLHFNSHKGALRKGKTASGPRFQKLALTCCV